jgi:hypothetical protein
MVGGEGSASRPSRFDPTERALGTHWIGGWEVPISGLNDMEEQKFFTLLGLELRSLGSPACSQSLRGLSLIILQLNVYVTLTKP